MILDEKERYMCKWIPAPSREKTMGGTWWVDAFDNDDALKRTIHENGAWHGTYFMIEGDVIEIHKYLKGTTESTLIFRAVKGSGCKWVINEDPAVCTNGHGECTCKFNRLASYPVCSTFELDDFDQWTKRQYKDKYPHPSSDKKPNLEANDGKESQNQQDTTGGAVV